MMLLWCPERKSLNVKKTCESPQTVRAVQLWTAGLTRAPTPLPLTVAPANSMLATRQPTPCAALPRLLLFLAGAVACLCPGAVVGVRVPPPYVVDLDSPPEVRWAGAVASVLRVHPWEHSFGPVFEAHNASLFQHLTVQDYSLLAGAMDNHYPEQAAELRGLSAAFAESGHPVTYNYLCAWVWFHELAHTSLAPPALRAMRACTGVLAYGADGRVMHGRNMDQSPAQVSRVPLANRGWPCCLAYGEGRPSRLAYKEAGRAALPMGRVAKSPCLQGGW